MSAELVEFPGEDGFERRRKVLMHRRRIRRRARVPSYIRREVTRGFPFRLKTDLEGYEVHYRRSNWMPLHDDPYEEPWVRVRETFAWIIRQGERVGAVGLREFSAPCASADEFAVAMDNEDGELGGLASALVTAWPDLNIVGFGPIIELTCVWVVPGHEKPKIWRPVVTALLRKLPPRYSILVAYALPLEYAGLRRGGDAIATWFRAPPGCHEAGGGSSARSPPASRAIWG